MSFRAVLLILVLSTISEGRMIQARRRLPPAPRLPPPSLSSDRDPAQSANTHAKLWGLETGILGQRNGNGLLGMDALVGLRAFEYRPIWGSFIWKPSVGLFYQNQSQASAGVTTYDFEMGVGLYYVPPMRSRFRWRVGAINHVDLMLVKLSLLNDSSTSPLAVRYRVGPAAGITYAINKQVAIVSDLSFEFALSRPTETYLGLTFGLGFKL